jgi:hypothetical protein
MSSVVHHQEKFSCSGFMQRRHQQLAITVATGMVKDTLHCCK